MTEATSPFFGAPNHGRHVFTDHDCGEVGVGSRHSRHDRQVDHAQVVDTVHMTSRVDHGADAARCRGMGAPVDDTFYPSVDCRSAVEIRKRGAVEALDLSSHVGGERWVRENFADYFDAAAQALEIAFITSQIQVDV